MRLAGKGEAGLRGGPAGDLYAITRVGESPVFARRGDNLEVEVPITIPEAIRGATIEVPTLSGTKRIRVPPGTKHGTVQRLRGEGPPKLSGRGRGDIHYRLNIDVPSYHLPRAGRGGGRAGVGDRRQSKGGAALAAPLGRSSSHGSVPDSDRGVYMISVAAELAGMHPQTLRIYECARPDHAQALTQEHAALLAGGRRSAAAHPGADHRAGHEPGRGGGGVFELEREIDRMRRRMRNLERQAGRVQEELEAELERVRRSVKREMVLYEPPGQELMARGPAVRVRIERPQR